MSSARSAVRIAAEAVGKRCGNQAERDLVESIVEQRRGQWMTEHEALLALAQLDENIGRARKDERLVAQQAMAKVIASFVRGVQHSKRVVQDEDLVEGAALVLEVMKDFQEILGTP